MRQYERDPALYMHMQLSFIAVVVQFVVKAADL